MINENMVAPPAVRIQKIEPHDTGLIKAFVDFPFSLYRQNSFWVPELRRTTFEALNRDKHPFYEHSEAAFFIATQSGVPVGRIAALENRRYNAYKRKSAGFFGYFESINHQEVADQLLTTAVDWCRSRQLTEIIGPRGVMGLDGKILVSGFDTPPSLGESYNFPYYDQLIQTYGFVPESDYVTGYFPATARPTERYQKVVERLKKRGNFSVKSFKSRSEVLEWLPRLLALQKEAFGETRTFYPITEREMQNTMEGLKFVADPRLIKLLMKEDQPVGILLALPDISAGLRRSRGRLFPFGWLPILFAKWTTRQVVMPAIGILPDYLGLGGNAILHSEIAHTINHSKFESVEVGPIDTANRTSLLDMEKQGVQWIKKHRLYQYQLKREG